MNQKRNLADVMKDGEKRQAAYDRQKSSKTANDDADISQKVKTATENSRKTFYREFSKVVECADVVLEVLDARDPAGSRCAQMEAAIRASAGAKKLILVLNKIDLVPKANVEAWLKHLRLELPTVAFKASTQEQRDNLSQARMDHQRAGSAALGADVLMKLLRNYCRETSMSINVGVVGFPNTGKSSLINSLKRSRVCDVGAVPGITKAMQTVQLDKHVRLVDSPGVVLAADTTDVAAVLRNVVKLEAVADPTPCVEAILARCQKAQMMLHYNIPDYSDTAEFLVLLARRFGKLKRGGVADVARAARTLLQDWNSGKITYYTAPPEKEDSQNTSVHIGATIVSGFSKEFNIDEIKEDEVKMMEGLPAEGTKQHMLIPGLAPLTALTEEQIEEAGVPDQDEEDMEEGGAVAQGDQLAGVSVVPGPSKGKVKIAKATVPADFRHRSPSEKAALKTVGGLTTRKDRKMMEKREKRKKKKSNALAGQLSDAMSTAFSGL